MALFKILSGNSTTFNTNISDSNVKPPFNEGYCYFVKDTKKFYIDWIDENGERYRTPLNANALLSDNLGQELTSEDVNNRILIQYITLSNNTEEITFPEVESLDDYKIDISFNDTSSDFSLKQKYIQADLSASYSGNTLTISGIKGLPLIITCIKI